MIEFLNQAYFFTGPFLISYIPVALLTWLFSRKYHLYWRLHEFLSSFFSLLLWFTLTFFLNAAKTLGNTAIEPCILGGAMGGLVFLNIFVPNAKAWKLPLFLLVLIVFTVVFHFSFPMLQE